MDLADRSRATVSVLFLCCLGEGGRSGGEEGVVWKDVWDVTRMDEGEWEGEGEEGGDLVGAGEGDVGGAGG